MSNEVKVTVPDFGVKADDMTHRLKVFGNGSMLQGIRKIYAEAYAEGGKVRFKKGILCGAIGTAVATLVLEGGRRMYHKAKLINKENIGEPAVTKVFTKEQINKAKQDMDFPWEKIKSHMINNYKINYLSFETWIEPLVCKAYSDRILLVLPDSSDVEIAYVKEEYKRLVKNSVFEVTGKKYIVTFVRPDEILIEDEI